MVLRNATVTHSFRWLYSIPLCDYSTVYSAILLLTALATVQAGLFLTHLCKSISGVCAFAALQDPSAFTFT